jgi:hypothetical protein
VSHFSRIKTQMVERELLLRALFDLGYQAEAGELTIGGYAWQKTAVEIRVETEGYAIGFRKEGDAYVLVGDWWGVKGISRARFLKMLAQRYSYLAARSELEKQGFTVAAEERDKEGRVHLVLRRVV